MTKLFIFLQINQNNLFISAIVSLTTKDKITGVSKNTTVAILAKGHSFGVSASILTLSLSLVIQLFISNLYVLSSCKVVL